MKRFLVGALAVLGALVLLAAILFGGVAVIAAMGKPGVASKTVLEADFEKGIVENVPDDPFGQLFGKRTPTILGVVEALEKAGDDPKVVGLVAKIGNSGTGGVAQIQEIRDAVIAFRKKGKKAVAWSETFGEFSAGNGSYYLASAFDEIWLQPSGDVGLTGLMAESMFLRGTFDKLGMVPRMDHRYEYKTAMNQYTEKKYTEAHKESNQKVLDSIFGQIVRGVAEGRKLSEADVRGLIDRGPFLGKEAVDAKLVDGLAYRDEVYDKVREKLGKDAKTLSLADYRERAGGPWDDGENIALIYGVGAVQRGKSKYSPFTGSQAMGSDTVAKAFRQAIEDKSVKAILFRVNSPGGSYVASDTIWRETVRAQKAGKPVVVSMGDVAGSGGYFVAMHADKIVAQPGTITASIGVLGGKFLMNGLFDKVGLSFDEIHTSSNATMFSTTHDFSTSEWARFEAWLDRVYEDFTGKVAEGRRLPIEKVKEIAKGRIWSGEDARGLGLVDELGGYQTAIKLVRQAAKLSEKTKIRLKEFPEHKTPFERLADRMSGREDEASASAAAVTAEALESLRPLFAAAKAAGVLGDDGVLQMEDAEIAKIR